MRTHTRLIVPHEANAYMDAKSGGGVAIVPSFFEGYRYMRRLCSRDAVRQATPAVLIVHLFCHFSVSLQLDRCLSALLIFGRIVVSYLHDHERRTSVKCDRRHASYESNPG